MCFLTDIIDKEECYKWIWGRNLVFIFSGTGSGKTTFALNQLSLLYLEQYRGVLYLVPRIILKEQIENDMRTVLDAYPDNTQEYNQNFNVWTYQQLENAILCHRLDTIPAFDLLICDEYHYFISDSVFNSNTQLSYNYIFHNDNKPSNNTVVLLTATPNNIMGYMYNNLFYKTEKKYDDNEKFHTHSQWETAKEVKVYYDDKNSIFYNPIQVNTEYLSFRIDYYNVYIYKLPRNYDYLDIKYLINESEIISLVKKTKKKSIIFVSNKNKGKKLEKELLENKVNVVYINAENKGKENRNNVEELKDTKTFPQQVFITTSVLDVGVNFFDKDITNVIIAHTEPMEMLQMLGRVRVRQTGQKISLFIFQSSSRYFQNLLKKNIIKKIQCCEYLEDENLRGFNYILYEELKPNDLPDGYRDFIYLNTLNMNYDEYDDVSYVERKIGFNRLAPYYLRQLHTLYNDIYNEMMKGDKNYFIKKQLEFLGRENDFSEKNFYCLECLQENIKTKIKKSKNGMLQEECKNMLSELQPLVRTMDKSLLRSNEKLSVKVFNNFCKTYDINYCIAQKEDSKIKKTRYYILEPDDNIINQLGLTIQF